MNMIEKSRLQTIVKQYLKGVTRPPRYISQIPYEHAITLSDNIPVACKPYKIPKEHIRFIYNQIDYLLSKGVIDPSDSLYGSPGVALTKKDGTIQLSCDFRKLNEKTIPMTYPIPRTENFIPDEVRGAEVFTILDLKSAYWHYIPIRRQDQHKTAFVVRDSKYQWNVMPFGITNTSFSLAYVMNEVLHEFEFARSFYNTCLLFGKRSEHLSQIDVVLQKFAMFGIHVNLSTSRVMKRQVTFVGHIINRTGVRPEKYKNHDVIDYKRPSNVKELQSFLGMANYFSNFIERFAEKSACLSRLVKKNVTFEWSWECEESFRFLKEKLENTTALRRANYHLPFVLATDVSDKAMGFALMQEFDGHLRPIVFGGRALAESEQRYSTTEKELLAVYFSVKHCEFYLVGHAFVVYTDHRPLIQVYRESVTKRFRWIEYLQSINTVLKFISRKENVLSDDIARVMRNGRLSMLHAYHAAW